MDCFPNLHARSVRARSKQAADPCTCRRSEIQPFRMAGRCNGHDCSPKSGLPHRIAPTSAFRPYTAAITENPQAIDRQVEQSLQQAAALALMRARLSAQQQSQSVQDEPGRVHEWREGRGAAFDAFEGLPADCARAYCPPAFLRHRAWPHPLEFRAAVVRPGATHPESEPAKPGCAALARATHSPFGQPYRGVHHKEPGQEESDVLQGVQQTQIRAATVSRCTAGRGRAEDIVLA